MKFKPDMRLVSRELVSEGPVQLVIRSEYKIGKKSSTVYQVSRILMEDE